METRHYQTWLHRRMANLTPAHFMDGIQFCGPPHIAPPAAFAHCWARLPPPGCPEAFRVTPLEEDAPGIVIFASLLDSAHVASVAELVAHTNRSEADLPPLFLANHSVEPELRPPASEGLSRLSRELMYMGIDGVVPGEPEGLALVLSVRAVVSKCTRSLAQLNERAMEQRERVQRVAVMKACVENILWDYLRFRCADCIPPVDFNIPEGDARQIDGYDIGRKIGEGMCGRVLMLSRRPGAPKPKRRAPSGVSEVVKVVGKEKTVGLSDLKYLRRMVDVMQLLSSARWRHPNVVQLYEIYHSPTHLYFRMEYGGHVNLFRRLVLAQKMGNSHTLSFSKCASIISQALGVVSFIQRGPQVCHRDLKPENFTVGETADEVTLKLCDFDLACVQDRKHPMCRSPCGTVPFIAPEVMLRSEFDAFAADVWSLGVVLLEIVCCTRFFHQALNLRTDKHDELAHTIRAFFQAPNAVSNMLQGAVRPDLLPLMPQCQEWIEGILVLEPAERVRAEQLQVFSENVLVVARAAAGR